MKLKHAVLLGAVVVASLAIWQGVSTPSDINIAQQPLFARAPLPPLNMLVMGRDHKLYYEAYNDASDLDDDGVLDVGYKPDSIDYYGYYNSKVCYTYDAGTGKFTPNSSGSGARGKKCSGMWSGDFLNYVTTSRMDALRKVLYGGHRDVDTTTQTVLQASFTPQDAHSWGKEYQSVARDGYNISEYTPLSAPGTNRYHLFAVTTLSDNGIPQLRVLNNTNFRVWNWVSIERPVAGDDCFGASSNRLNCVTGSTSAGGWAVVPSTAYAAPLQVQTWRDSTGSPANQAGMDSLFSGHSTATYCGTWNVNSINTTGSNNNAAAGSNSCTNDNYHTLITGTLNIAEAGNYKFAVNGDDAVDVFIDGTRVAGWYNGHGANSSSSNLDTYSGTINLGVGTHTVVFRHEEGSGDDNWQLYWQPPNTGGAVSMTNYALRVETCPASTALRDDTCKVYPSGAVKPTGILHDYGETERMYFGLLTGSYAKNISGGVLRKNVGSFANEINADTGQFCLNNNCGVGNDVKGIVHTITTFRMLDFSYGSQQYGCGWITTRPVNEGECWMWGNPVAEMMYEALRYFGGATTPRTEFNYSSGPDDSTLHLAKPAWKPPYASVADGGAGYPKCSQPAMTVISDINPSYDYSLPGSHWDALNNAADPATVKGLVVSGQVDQIWVSEGGGTRRIYIGESNGVVDNAPTPKDVANLSTVRGLSPEEPSKRGTYYSAGVARYGATNKIGGDKFMRTYSVALASPLPKFDFPVGTGRISLVPFAKSVGGSGIDPSSNFQPTDQIVDFYVQKVANTSGTSGADYDASVNGGRPYAEFRINFEDVEQGADHDMDAITLYTLKVTAAGQLEVRLDSEYAAGGIDQYMGYIISGTSQDGVYLEVKDQGGTNQTYRLSTPPGRAPGYCDTSSPPSDCGSLPLTTTRTFTIGTGTSAGLLRDPLWYAAKYGTDQATKVNADGEPINYFLVTNPLYLRQQLLKTFDAIQAQSGNSGTASLAGARVSGDSFIVLPSYSSLNDGHDWIGNLTAYSIQTTGANAGLPGAERWNAASRMPSSAAGVNARKIFTALGQVNNANRATQVVDFRATSLGGSTAAQFSALGYTLAQITDEFGGSTTPNDLVNYLRGEKTKEGGAFNVAPFRTRTSILGDIIGSGPVVASKKANYGWAAAGGLPTAARSSYSAYVTAKSGSGTREYAYVGANDGMVHAFDGTNGDELFAYIPNGVLNRTGLLADPDYTHRYYVDGQLALGDVYDGSSWKTVLAGASGAGGRGVFSLDVSNPGSFAAANVLWEVNSQTDSDIGYVMGKPVIVPLENGSWAALFGNGYNSGASDKGDAILFAVDVFSGAVIAKIHANDGDTANPNGLGNIAALDTNGNGLIDTVYGGDLLGNVWKFNLSATSASSWNVAFSGAPLFVALDRDGHRQPITGGLDVAVGPGQGYMVYFGSGKYFAVGDNNADPGQQVQSLYGIFDNGTPLTGDRDSVLVEQEVVTMGTSAGDITRNSVDYLTHRGWFIDLIFGTADTGQRFVGQPRIQSGRILFDAYQPGLGSDCEPGGQNLRYGLNLMTGGAALGQVKTADGQTLGGGSTGVIVTTSGAPNREVAVTQPPTAYPPLYCDPADPSCTPGAPGAKCSEVIIDPNDTTKSLIIQRACGRQSWRQLR